MMDAVTLGLLAIIPVIVILAIIMIIARGGSDFKPSAVLGSIVAVGVVLVITISVMQPAIETTTYPNVIGEETNDLDVFLLIGQSNAAAGNSDPDAALPVAEYDRAFYYGSSTSPPVFSEAVVEAGTYSLDGYAIYSMADSDGSAVIGNIDMPFAAKYSKLSGNKVLVINAGVGGTNILQWQPGEAVYNYAYDVFTNAIAAIPDDTFDSVNLKSVLWVQGENNAYTNVQDYIEGFETLWESIKSDWVNGSDAFDSILLNQVSKSIAPNAYLAQSKIPDAVDGAYLACTAANDFTLANGLMGSDGIHYTQKGDNIIGVAFANYQYFEV